MRLNDYDRDNKLVINLVGIPGVGKTTLINNIKDFFNKANLPQVGVVDYMVDGNDKVLELTEQEMSKRLFELPETISNMEESIIFVETPPLSALLFSYIEDNISEDELYYLDNSIKHNIFVKKMLNIGLQPDSFSNMNKRVQQRLVNREREGFDLKDYRTLYQSYNHITKYCDYLINNGSAQDVLDDLFELLSVIPNDKPKWTFVVGKSGAGKSTFINELTKRKEGNINIKITDSKLLNHNNLLKQLSFLKSDVTFDRCPFIEDLVYNNLDLDDNIKPNQFLNRNDYQSVKGLINLLKNNVDIEFIVVGDSYKHMEVLNNMQIEYLVSDEVEKGVSKFQSIRATKLILNDKENDE